MSRIFGTDGVRGIANSELTSELAFKLGRAGAYVLTKEKHRAPRILVGTDTRISCDMLQSALTAGMCSVGATAVIGGILPTPAVSYYVRSGEYDAGVVISASHNSFEYNGIKFFNNDGNKLRDELEDEIESLLDDVVSLPSPTGKDVGVIEYLTEEESTDGYIAYLKGTSAKLDGFKICIDCANGASYKAAPLLLESLGAEVLVINNEPNGININHQCGSTHIEGLIDFVKESEADVGLAFDGDADRLLAVDENGRLVDGDQILAVCGTWMNKKGLLNKSTVVATVMSNLGLTLMGNRENINVLKTVVGDRYVLDEMLKNGYNLGGEQSGHIIFLDDSATGDGLLTGLKVINIMKETGEKLSQLASVMEVLPSVLVSAHVSNDKKYTFMNYEEIKEKVTEMEKKYADNGRFFIRTSGTEALIRIMIEGENAEEMKKDAEAVAKLIENKLR